MGETSDYFMDNGARYWELIDGLFGVIEEIKAPTVAGALMSRLSIRQLIKILVGYRSFHQPRLPALRLKPCL